MSQIVISTQQLSVAVIEEGVSVYSSESPITLAEQTQELILTVEDTVTRIISVVESGPQGVKGDKGDKGDPGGIYVYDNPVPSATWEINHNLNNYPVPQVVDSSGSAVEGDVTYVSANTLTVSFSNAFAGKAYLAY